MKSLKRFVKKIFFKYYKISNYDIFSDDDLSVECNGRIIRSFADTKKSPCAAYVLNGMKNI